MFINMKKKNEKENLNVHKNFQVQQQSKEIFEQLDIKIVDVKVESGYATSGHDDPITIQQWNNGTW